MYPTGQPQNCKAKAVRVTGETDTLKTIIGDLKLSEITEQADKKCQE